MSQPANAYFALIAPVCVLLFGLALLACWYVQRRQSQAAFLRWLVGGYVLLAIALALQSLMSNAQLGQFSLATALLYLSGSWSLAQGMSLRLGGQGASRRVGLLIALLTLGVLFYFSRIDNNLHVRIQSLTLAMGLLQSLALPALFKAIPSEDGLERSVRWAYGLNVCNGLLRPLIVSFIPAEELQELTRSGYWALTQAVALWFAMWFTVSLLAYSVRNVMTNLREERNRDPLTSLLNRRAFTEAAQAVLTDRRLAPWALVAVDIDHFKQINDNWGHGAGDQVLEQMGQLLPQQVRGRDLVARFGGEEFMLLLTRVRIGEAHAIVEQIREQIKAHVFEHLPGPLRMTASFGIAPLHSVSELPHALTQADALLYQAKKAGRDCVLIAAALPPEGQQCQRLV